MSISVESETGTLAGCCGEGVALFRIEGGTSVFTACLSGGGRLFSGRPLTKDPNLGRPALPRVARATPFGNHQQPTSSDGPLQAGSRPDSAPPCLHRRGGLSSYLRNFAGNCFVDERRQLLRKVPIAGYAGSLAGARQCFLSGGLFLGTSSYARKNVHRSPRPTLVVQAVWPLHTS